MANALMLESTIEDLYQLFGKNENNEDIAGDLIHKDGKECFEKRCLQHLTKLNEELMSLRMEKIPQINALEKKELEIQHLKLEKELLTKSHEETVRALTATIQEKRLEAELAKRELNRDKEYQKRMHADLLKSIPQDCLKDVEPVSSKEIVENLLQQREFLTNALRKEKEMCLKVSQELKDNMTFVRRLYAKLATINTNSNNINTNQSNYNNVDFSDTSSWPMLKMLFLFRFDDVLMTLKRRKKYHRTTADCIACMEENRQAISNNEIPDSYLGSFDGRSQQVPEHYSTPRQSSTLALESSESNKCYCSKFNSGHGKEEAARLTSDSITRTRSLPDTRCLS